MERANERTWGRTWQVREQVREERWDDRDQGKARVAADHIKGIALPGSRTLSEGCRWNGQARAGRLVGVCYRVPARSSPWRLEASWGWVWEIVRKGRVSWNHRGKLIRRSWLAVLQREKELRYCSKAGKKWWGWRGQSQCESKGWNGMRNRGLCKRLKLQREIQTRGSRMCGHWDLISLWEIFEVYLPAAASEEKEGEWNGQKDRTGMQEGLIEQW